MPASTSRPAPTIYEGDGPLLLFVHGHPFNRSMWNHQITYFSRNGFRAVAPDLRGYRESTVVEGTSAVFC